MAKAQRYVLLAATVIVGLRLLTLQTPTPSGGLRGGAEEVASSMFHDRRSKPPPYPTPAALSLVAENNEEPQCASSSGPQGCGPAAGVPDGGAGGRSVGATSSAWTPPTVVDVASSADVQDSRSSRPKRSEKSNNNLASSAHAKGKDKSQQQHVQPLSRQAPHRVLPQLKSPRAGPPPQQPPAKHIATARRQHAGAHVAPHAVQAEPRVAVLEAPGGEDGGALDSSRAQELEEPASGSARAQEEAGLEGLDDQEASEEETGGTLVADASYPHANPQLWLSQRLAWLHLLKKPGATVEPVVLAAQNVDARRHTKYKIWSTMQVKNMALDDFFKYLPVHDYGASRTPQHKTCALVGNSGILLGSQMGQTIDSHEAVMRINYPPTRGFEDDVGSKTTYDFSNRENARRLLNARRIPKRPTPSTIIYFEVSSPVNRRTLFGPLMDKYPDQPIHFLHPDFVFRSIRLWAELQLELEARMKKKFKKKPMSGWLAMMFMIQMCEKLDVYGFEAYNNPHAAHRYHYFDKVKAVLQHHSFDFAVEAYKLLGKVHPVTLH